MPTRIQVSTSGDPEQSRIMAAAPQVGVSGLVGCRVWRVYCVESAEAATSGRRLGPEGIRRLCRGILVDPVTDEVVIGDPREDGQVPAGGGQVVEVAPIPGVTDTAARELERAAATLGLPPIRAVTARRYELEGEISEADIGILARRLLANPTIERFGLGPLPPRFAPEASAELRAAPVPVVGLDDDGLLDLSCRRMLALDLDEMRAIRAHFEPRGRDPTDAELETLAQTWSEHCCHKTFNAGIVLEHTDPAGTVAVWECEGGMLGLLRRATARLDKPWLRSAFVDNAGIVAFDDRFDLAVKVETHNHPSALEPFGGANTGVGGVVRDVLGVSARPIACTDVLCFGPADLPDGELPDGVLHPERVRAGVAAGVGDYGNKLGLPTVNGAVLYDRGYIGNPLVFCGALGLLPSGSHPSAPMPGDRIVLLGGRTGRDGVRGATFSSAGLDAGVADRAGSAVQIGDPITEKGCIEVVERARDAGLYNAITDCGAGGLSSAVGEMGARIGAEVDLAAVPLKYPGLQPWEIWLSEAQERMVMAVSPDSVGALEGLARAWDVEVSDIGAFTDTGRLLVRHSGVGSAEKGGGHPLAGVAAAHSSGAEAGEAAAVVDLPMALLHDGRPRRRMRAVHRDPAPAADPVPGADPTALLLELLAHPNAASSEPIVRTYDHEVGGGAVVRPFVGPGADGPSDAAVLKPLDTWHHDRAVALSVGIAPRIGRIDPRAMALHCIDEAFRNLVAVGADPGRVALLDNFCWGDPTRPDRLGSLARAVQGCAEGAARYEAPFVSGKDSLNNEFDGRPVPGTLLISAVGVVPDMRRSVTSDLKEPGDDLWLVGEGDERLGGSLAAEVLGICDTRAPAAVADPLDRYGRVHRLMAAGRIRAAHDASDGGLGVALAEMAIGGRLGLRAVIPAVSGDGPGGGGAGAERGVGGVVGASDLNVALGNEAPGRLVLEAPSGERAAVAAALGPLGRRIGEVADDDVIEIRAGVLLAGDSAVSAGHPVSAPEHSGSGVACARLTVSEARRAFQTVRSRPDAAS